MLCVSRVKKNGTHGGVNHQTGQCGKHRRQESPAAHRQALKMAAGSHFEKMQFHAWLVHAQYRRSAPPKDRPAPVPISAMVSPDLICPDCIPWCKATGKDAAT